MKFYITFGQSHAHSIAGKTFDRNCVAEINGEDRGTALKEVSETFGKKWCHFHDELPDMRYYPRGVIKI